MDYVKERNNNLKEIDDNIQKLVNSKCLSGKYIVIAPLSRFTGYIIDRLYDHNIAVDAVMDNNERCHGIVESGVITRSFEDCLIESQQNNKEIYFLIASSYEKEISEQITEILHEKALISVLLNKSSCRRTLELESKWNVEKQIENLMLGYDVYTRVLEQIGGRQAIGMIPADCMGDFATAMHFLQAIDEKDVERFVLLIVKGFMEKLLVYSGLNRFETIIITPEEADSLLLYKRMVPEAEFKIIIPFFAFDYYDFWYWNLFPERGIRPVISMYGHMLNMNKFIMVWNHNKDISQKKTKKKILLSPYQKSVKCLPMRFWNELAIKFNEKGYELYTNCGGKREKPVLGSEPLFFPLEQSHEVLAEFDYFIASRSGFCDLVCGGGHDCKKIIIYDSARTLKICGFNNNMIGSHVKEFVYTEYESIVELENIIVNEVISHG